jgi:hypothetical protein
MSQTDLTLLTFTLRSNGKHCPRLRRRPSEVPIHTAIAVRENETGWATSREGEHVAGRDDDRFVFIQTSVAFR